MKEILQMNRTELLWAPPRRFKHLLSSAELLHVAATFKAMWQYNYEKVLRTGEVLDHVEIASGRHSDGLFFSRVLLEDAGLMRNMVADQMLMRLTKESVRKPDYIIGVPKSATPLAQMVAHRWDVKVADMVKENGRMVLKTDLPPRSIVLFMDDVCTRGTGITEAVLEVFRKHPNVIFVLVNPVILNRGGLKDVFVEGVGSFRVIPLLEERMSDWAPKDCPLCKIGSRAIKGKETPEIWRQLLLAHQ